MKLTTLALSNIKRNFKKYAMYFFSLSFSVFTAYTFFALMQNKYVLMAFTYDDRYKALLKSFGIIIIVFVMFFLISSNNSFIKARKREISTYALFGMTNGRIGRLIFLETIIVGTIALIIGIGVGIFFSKLMAMILLDISLASFTGKIEFTIAPKAAYITTIIFMSIFCVMGLSGLRVINKFELVDLFKAHKVSEGRSKGSVIVLILSLILIGAGYYLASSSNVRIVVNAAIPVLFLVVTGTYLFFWGGLPKVLNLIKSKKSNYYRGVNLISVSAFYHRVKSIAMVMATIAVLSAVATTAIATGYTLYNNIENNTYEQLGYDMYFYGGQEELLGDVEAAFEAHGNEIIEEFTAQRYTCSPSADVLRIKNSSFNISKDDYFRVYSESIYNKLMSITRCDYKTVSIKSGEAIYVYPFMIDNIADAITGQALTFTDEALKVTATIRAGILSFGAIHTIVINDADFDILLNSGDITDTNEGGAPYDKVTVFKYQQPLSSPELNRELTQILSGNTGSFRTAYTLYDESLQTFGLVCFIGFFMGGVFILMTASLLYFKQIMAAEEERHQYRMLRKIGMDDYMEKRVIAKRLIPVFLIPLLVGIVHSIFAMKSADTLVFSNMIADENSYSTVLLCSAVMYGIYAIVYSIFYFITKGQYSRIVK
ncbi:FtsX-like permease family protein [Marinisporobacter balticus]|uniref:Putative ABC transport system permease protein n=1 Tax=Marinisporobacter balticus TaxID=2018667 RepID=A0A4R2LJ03_9FIRM|nr:ABC transporter permease [Marinisporobacter balticus]TCO79335.1 putative ABC transport system permease protein [Marinisporobacter balticus]